MSVKGKAEVPEKYQETVRQLATVLQDTMPPQADWVFFMFIGSAIIQIIHAPNEMVAERLSWWLAHPEPDIKIENPPIRGDTDETEKERCAS